MRNIGECIYRIRSQRRAAGLSASGLGLFSLLLTGSMAIRHTQGHPPPTGPEGYTLGFGMTSGTDPDGAVHMEVFLRARQGGYRTRLTSDPSMRFYHAALSPDLNRLALIGERMGPEGAPEERGVYVASVQRRRDGRPVRAGVLEFAVDLPNADVSNLTLCWMGDSARVVYPVRQFGERAGQDLWSTDVDTGESRPFVHIPGSRLSNPAFSRTARRIAFTANVRGEYGKRRDIFTCDESGRDLRRVTSPDNCPDRVNLFPEWSPDGSSILFIGEIRRYRIPADGSGAALPIETKPGLASSRWGSPASANYEIR